MKAIWLSRAERFVRINSAICGLVLINFLISGALLLGLSRITPRTWWSESTLSTWLLVVCGLNGWWLARPFYRLRSRLLLEWCSLMGAATFGVTLSLPLMARMGIDFGWQLAPAFVWCLAWMISFNVIRPVLWPPKVKPTDVPHVPNEASR